MDGWRNWRWIDGWMDRRIDRKIRNGGIGDGWMDRRVDRQMRND